MWPASIVDNNSSTATSTGTSAPPPPPPSASGSGAGSRPSTGQGGSGSSLNGRLHRIPSFTKAFKFKSSKSKNNNNNNNTTTAVTTQPPPPPLPPKDFVTYRTSTLSPDTLSIPPNSPVSPSLSPSIYHQYQHHNASAVTTNNNNNANNNAYAPFHSRTTPGPSQSTISLISSSAASSRSQQTLETRQSRLKAKASSLFTFVKKSGARSVKSPDPERDRPTTAPHQGDAGISTPWNFQHNIHVDEAFIGLPPSWTTRLSQAGFSPEEIAAIQARRMNIYSGRPDSPNLRINTAPPATTSTPMPGRPSPGEGGSASLRRHPSDASLQSGHSHQPTSPPPQTQMVSSPSSVSLHSVGTTTTTTTNSGEKLSPTVNGGSGHRRHHHHHQHHQHHRPSPSSASSSAGSSERIVGERTVVVVAAAAAARTAGMDQDESVGEHGRNECSVARQSPPPPPSTPPRRTLHVVNAQIVASPPPAYSQFATYTPDKKVPVDHEDKSGLGIAGDGDGKDDSDDSDNDTAGAPLGLVQVTPSAHRSRQSNDLAAAAAAAAAVALGAGISSPSRRASIIRNKRTSILPPRLSLHKTTESLDLTSWSAELLSGISSSSSSFHSNKSDGSLRSIQRFQTPLTNVTSPPLSQPSSSKSDLPSLRSPLAVQEPIGPLQATTTTITTTTHRRQGSSSRNPLRPVPPIIVRDGSPEADYDRDDNDNDGDNGPPPPTGWAEPASANRVSPSDISPLPPPPTQPLPSPPLTAPTSSIRGLDSATLTGMLTPFDGLVDNETESFSPAVEDTHSPVLPLSPKLNVTPAVSEATAANLIPGWRRSRHGGGGRLFPPPSLPLPLSPPPPTPREAHRQLLTVPGEVSLQERVVDRHGNEGVNDDDDNDDDPDGSFLVVDDAATGASTRRSGDYRHSHRSSARSSTSTMSTISTATVVGYGERALVRNASVVRRTSAYVIDTASNPAAVVAAGAMTGRLPQLGMPQEHLQQQHMKLPSSPMSSHFGSEDGSLSSDSPSQDRHPTPTETDSPLSYYIGATYTPSPSRLAFATKAPVHLLVSTSGTFGGVVGDVVPEDDEEEEGAAVGQRRTVHDDEKEIEREWERDNNSNAAPGLEGVQRPRIVINSTDPSPTTASSSIALVTPGGITPQTPAPRYRGWLSEVVRPLEDFIDEAIDPREYYIDLTEIAEGESGSVFAAQLTPNHDLKRLRLDPALVAQDRKTLASGEPVAVAIKSVAIVPSGSPKLVDLERELKLMRGLQQENILSMDALYVDLVEDSLWIRMELMERSLADVVSLVEAGLVLPDRMIARFASDVVQALQFLQNHNIAHRDVRSDNLLLNIQGIVKLADFSTAVQISPSAPLRSDIVGVAYWQAPEVRNGPYNVLKVDIWSLGATVWELAEAEPPFARTQQLLDRFPSLSDPKLFSPPFHDFLNKCSEPPESRPDADHLSLHPFMKNACGRGVIIQLLAQCMTIEKQQYQNEES